MSQCYASAFLSPSLLPPSLPPFHPPSLPPFHPPSLPPSLPPSSQYLGKTHNFWHGSTLILEERAYSEGELPAKSREPPPYDGNYSDQILNPLKHVSPEASWLCRTVFPTSPHPSSLSVSLPPLPPSFLYSFLPLLPPSPIPSFLLSLSPPSPTPSFPYPLFPLSPPSPFPSFPYFLPLSLCLPLFLPGDARRSPGALL